MFIIIFIINLLPRSQFAYIRGESVPYALLTFTDYRCSSSRRVVSRPMDVSADPAVVSAWIKICARGKWTTKVTVIVNECVSEGWWHRLSTGLVIQVSGKY